MAGVDLSLPKRVRFNNYRLNKLYNLLMLMTLGGMLFKVIYFKEWFAYVEMKDHVKAQLWVKHHQNFSQQVNALISTRDFCTNSSKLDYWWSSHPMYQYQDLSCAQVCSGREDSINCFHQEELYSREGSQTQVLFYSRMLEQTKPQGTQRQVLFPSVDVEAIDFRFEIRELVHDLVGAGFSLTGKYRSSTTDVLTVLRQGGKQLRILEPSPNIALSVEEILAMAGIPNALDEVRGIAGKNQKSGAFHPLGPAGRIAGVELAMNIQCYNYHRWTIEGDGKWSSYDGPICYIDTQPSPLAWVTSETISNDAKPVFRHYSGVRVKATGGGDYRSLNLDKLFSSIITVFVLARLPEKVVLFVAVNLLGHLSKIYHRVLFEPFGVQDAVSGLVLRLMTVQCLFNVLSSKKGMSKGTMMKRVQKAMEKEENLDKHELEVLVDLVFNHIVDEPEAFQTLFGELASLSAPSLRSLTNISELEEEEQHKKSIDTLDRRMDLQQFCHTYANQEAINFKDASVLFDKDRYISTAEKFFMPASLRRLILSERKRKEVSIIEESDSDSDEEEKKTSSAKSMHRSATSNMMAAEREGPPSNPTSRKGSKEIPSLELGSLPPRMETPLLPMETWSADTCRQADLDFLEKKMHHAMEERAQQLEVCLEERIQLAAEEAFVHNSQKQNPVHKTSSGLRLLSSLDTRLRDVEALIEDVRHQMLAKDRGSDSLPLQIPETSKTLFFKNVLATAGVSSPFCSSSPRNLPAKLDVRTAQCLVPKLQLHDSLLANHNAVDLDIPHHKDTTDLDKANHETGSMASERSTKELIQLSSRPAQMPFGREVEIVETPKKHKL